MPGIFDVLAANGILSSLFGNSGQANAATNPVAAMLDTGDDTQRMKNRVTGQGSVSNPGAPVPMIVQAMENGGVPVANPGASFLPPDAEQEMARAGVDPRSIPSGPDPFANTYNAAASAFQGAQGQAASLADTLGLKFDRPLARLAMGLGAAGSQDPLATLMKMKASEEDVRNSQSERNRTKVTPLADGAFSLVQKSGEPPRIVRNDEVANYLGEMQTTKFAQAIERDRLKAAADATRDAGKAAIKTAEDARPLLNDVNGMINRWTQAQEIIKGQGMDAQVQGAFPGIAGFFGGDQVAANKFLEGLTVDETLLNTARTKGAISNQEMNLFKQPIPSTTDDREKVWKPWIEKRIEVLGKLKTFYEGEVARGAAVGGNQPSGQPAPASSSGGPTRISSEAEWANLPSGTQYIGPDGKTRTKR